MRVAAVVYEFLIGTALVFAPWSVVWQQNWLFWKAGLLRPWLMYAPVRGAVSGIGAALVVFALYRIDGDTAARSDRPGEGGETASV